MSHPCRVNLYAADNSGQVLRQVIVTALQDGGGWADENGAWHDLPPAPLPDPPPDAPPPDGGA